MARPRTPSTAKPAQQRNTARDKMRMGYDRMRRDIKRTEAEQTKAAAAQTVKRGRRAAGCRLVGSPHKQSSSPFDGYSSLRRPGELGRRQAVHRSGWRL